MLATMFLVSMAVARIRIEDASWPNFTENRSTFASNEFNKMKIKYSRVHAHTNTMRRRCSLLHGINSFLVDKSARRTTKNDRVSQRY